MTTRYEERLCLCDSFGVVLKIIIFLLCFWFEIRRILRRSLFFFSYKRTSCKYFRYSELYLFGEKSLISVDSVWIFTVLCSFDCIAPRKIIRIPESGILGLRVQNPSNDWNSEFGIRNSESIFH